MPPISNILGNIRRGPITTILGLVFILAALSYVFWKEKEWSETIIPISIGLALLFAPDSLKKGGNKGSAAMLLLLAACGLSSCVTMQRCTEKFGQYATDTVLVTKVDTTIVERTIVLPGDSVGLQLQIDSLKQLKLYDTVLVKSPSNGTQLRYYRDAYNRLQINCQKTADTLVLRDTVVKEIQVQCPPQLTFSEQGKWYTAAKLWAAIGFIMGASFLWLALFLFKKIMP